ncbi:MAG TPA: peptide chain release factor N(5)-glutamine methyltransferase [Solirubrobacteraceae bacterium]|nr:peptide chain release factor N(5)-glutamine methyltransferase [Solirubrobacteraceae bacterium]
MRREPALTTVRELLGRSREYLERNGVPSPKLDAEYLLAHVLGVPRLELYLDHDRALTPGEVERLRELVRRRGKREPLAYVLGSWSFYGLELHCDARALVPRPETEVLVDRCLALLADNEAPSVVDVGTGTGAIALALASRLPAASVTATDLAPGALALARENATANGLAERVELLQGDLLAPVGGRRFDLVASNPPYVAVGEQVDPEVALYEPALAVYAERDGRAVHERLAAAAADVLCPGGNLVVEVAEGQAAWLAGHLGALGYTEIAVTADLRGIERVVEARRRAVIPTPR